MSEESYFKEKRVIDVKIYFPVANPANENETRKIHGELEINDDGVFLKTFCENRDGDKDLFMPEFDIVNNVRGSYSNKGFSINLKQLNLLDKTLDRRKKLSITTQSFKCKDVLVFNDIKPNYLSQITIYIDGLEDFFNMEQFKVGSIACKTNEFSFAYILETRIVSSAWSQKKEYIPSVIFQFSTPIQLCKEKVKELVRKFQVLHGFLTGKNYKIKKVLINEDQENEVEFYSDSFNVIENEQSKFSLLNYDDISEDVIAKWFSLSPATFDIYELFYGARLIQDKYQKFINFFTCLEVLVREYEVNYFDDNDFKKILEAITSVVEAQGYKGYKIDKRKKFLTQIKNLNTERRPLKDRIVECAKKEEFIYIFDKDIKVENIDAKIKELFTPIVEARDDIVHGRSFDGLEKLMDYNNILYRSVYFLILKKLGIDKDILLSRFKKIIFY